MINNIVETYNQELTPERIDKLYSISEIMQNETGISFSKHFICNISFGQKDANVVDLREVNNEAFINLTENPSMFEVAHEISHLLIDPYYESIADIRVRLSLTEGISDLSSLESLGISRKEWINWILSENQNCLDTLDKEISSKIIVSFLESDNEDKQIMMEGLDIDHVVGRTFLLQLVLLRPEMELKQLISCLKDHPPTRE